MGQLQAVEPQLLKLGYQLLAVSADAPAELRKSLQKHGMKYSLLSDNAMTAAQALMVQLSAFNTPQFEWVKSRLQGKAQPVPPTYQPEIAAEGIHWAALHERRELMIRFPSIKAIIGNKIVPEYADWVLSRMGYQSQQSPEPADPNRPNNLWQPVDEERDFGAHGRFDSCARTVSPQLFGTTHRRLLTLMSAALAVAGLAALFGKRRDS